jgi:NADPH:quinone reductase-like Zn-dependent oxidoreductase
MHARRLTAVATVIVASGVVLTWPGRSKAEPTASTSTGMISASPDARSSRPSSNWNPGSSRPGIPILAKRSIDATKRVLVHGGAGNVGAYAVQLARRVAREVIATAFSDDVAYVEALGADRVIDVQESRFEEVLTEVDVVLDTIGTDTQDRSFTVLRQGGVLVSAVSQPDQQKAAQRGVRALFFLVEVSSRHLEQLATLIQAGELRTCVGDVLPLADARIAHEMLAGKPHKRGKIVVTVDERQ